MWFTITAVKVTKYISFMKGFCIFLYLDVECWDGVKVVQAVITFFSFCHTNGGHSFESWFFVFVLTLEEPNLCKVLT